MTFQRAVVIAVMTDIMVTGQGTWASVAAVVLGGALWFFTDDPLPGAIERGLEDFARKHRRGGQ